MKKQRNTPLSGFTLIELLTVLAIIAILAGILIPTVGAVRKQANIAASKSQLSQYANAIQMFKSEYGYYPFVDGTSDKEYDLGSNSVEFIETLSGRTTDGDPTTTGGNRRQISFHSFSENEFLMEDDGTFSDDQLADRFNNTNIVMVIDGDGNGEVEAEDAPSEISKNGPIRAPVTAYVEGDEEEGYPSYALWE